MPAIFHNSTAADSSTNTAARPASASRSGRHRAPSAWPWPRGPRLHCRPPVRPPVPCVSSVHPQVLGLWGLFPGSPPATCPPDFSTPLPCPSVVSPEPTAPTPAGCLPTALAAICLSSPASPACVLPPPSMAGGRGGGMGWGCSPLPVPQQTRLPWLWVPSHSPARWVWPGPVPAPPLPSAQNPSLLLLPTSPAPSCPSLPSWVSPGPPVPGSALNGDSEMN